MLFSEGEVDHLVDQNVTVSTKNDFLPVTNLLLLVAQVLTST